MTVTANGMFNDMKIARILLGVILMTASLGFAGENIVYDDGTGAQIEFCLPIHDKWQDRDIEYSIFNIIVSKNDKFLLLAPLLGSKTDDGKLFCGKIIIPSTLVPLAEISMSGGPLLSTLGVSKKMKVADFKKIMRKKSWTEQE